MKARKEVIFVARSDEFGRIVSTIVGRMGLRKAAETAGISAAYMGQMKDGTIPSEEVLAKFAAGFKLDGDLAHRFWDAAKASKPEIDLEHIIQFACDAAGFGTMERWAVIDAFRKQTERSQETTNAA